MDLYLDIETYSSAELSKTGVYKYTEAPDFAILMLAYATELGGEVRCLDLTLTPADFFLAEEMEAYYQEVNKVIDWLSDSSVTKHAHNANFERTCCSQYFHISCPPEQWHCTMQHCAMLGLPLALGQVAKALNLEATKDTAGTPLINYFSKPCKPSKINGGRTRNLPVHARERWHKFMEYCRQDVVVEMALIKKLGWFKIPESEFNLWCLDQKSNDYGILLDRAFVKSCLSLDKTYRDALMGEAMRITGLDNPNSAAQLKEWLSDAIGEDVESLKKSAMPKLFNLAKDDPKTSSVLSIREQLSKSSVKKYVAMAHVIGSDDRCRGLLQFYGANRTGRDAGRLIQIQNLPNAGYASYDDIRELVRSGNYDAVMSYCNLTRENLSDVLSKLIRTAFIAPEGKVLAVTDFSQIEARVLPWLAEEQWAIDAFYRGEDIYKAAASMMFNVPIGKVDKKLRSKGKVAVLALGYGGGTNALINMGALNQGLTEDELQPIVDSYRSANSHIVRLWRRIEGQALRAVSGGQTVSIKGVQFSMYRDVLFMRLPSGRQLSYYKPMIITNRFGNDAVSYEGLNQETKKWERTDTFGGKLVENLVQATARDCMMEKFSRLSAMGFKIVMRVHDELVVEIDKEDCENTLHKINKIMSEPIIWATGLPLAAAGFTSAYYKKD